jgi:hypothetical protein
MLAVVSCDGVESCVLAAGSIRIFLVAAKHSGIYSFIKVPSSRYVSTALLDGW